MENTLAHWTGVPVTFPPEPVQAAIPPARVRRWSLEVGRGGLAICSTVEDYRPRVVTPSSERPSMMAMAIAAVAGGFALLLVGASAGRAWAPTPRQYQGAMIVPAAKPVPLPTASARANVEPRPMIGRAFPSAIPVVSADADPVAMKLTRAHAIARALETGDFQEWAAKDGTTGFAVAGPAEATERGTCRALAVLTRKIDGSDTVASSRECARPDDQPAR